MAINKSKVKRILFITLSNLGDIILTTPVFKRLLDEFPQAQIDIITGEPGREIFGLVSQVGELIIRAKKQSIKERLLEIAYLRKKKFDLVVDLRNTLISYVLGPRIYPNIFKFFKKAKMHKVEEHLLKLNILGINALSAPFEKKFFIPINREETKYVSSILREAGEEKIVIISPGAKSPLKRWDADKYALLADWLAAKLGCKILIIGNEDDVEVTNQVISRLTMPYVNLCCKTTVGALACLMKYARMVITNDSAPLHIASAANSPTLAIFGPSDERKYGPLAKGSIVVKPQVSCRPCEKAVCEIGRENGCLPDIGVEEVFQAAKKILSSNG